jgi:hypothetical protein
LFRDESAVALATTKAISGYKKGIVTGGLVPVERQEGVVNGAVGDEEVIGARRLLSSRR